MIKKFLKYTISAALLAATIQVTPAFASPATQATKQQIETTKGQIEDIETKIMQLDDRISVSMEKSNKLNDQITKQQGKIKETEADIEKAQKSLDVHKKVYSERLQSIQLEGRQSIASYAELLLSADNLSDFLTRFTAISSIMESDTALLNGLNEKQQALRDAEEKLHTEYDQLKDSQEELAAEQVKIEADKKEIETALAAAQSTLESQENQLAQQQAQEEAQRQAQLAQQRAQQQSKAKKTQRSAPVVNAPNISNTDLASRVIEYAKQFQGVPYLWGGTTPSGFDCSGFTSYVFRNAAGISLPRVSRDQQNFGTRISPSQVQPGDLVFRGSPAYHVGIYIGNGQYIHAPQTGDVVKISTYNPSKFTSAARVLH